MHKTYAKELLSSIPTAQRTNAPLNFRLPRMKKGNAAAAIAAVVCRRVSLNSGHAPSHKVNALYEWNEGVVNLRIIADREYMWTNIRPNIADEFHDAASSLPAAYLFVQWNPPEASIGVWSIPEPILYRGLNEIPFEEGQKWTIQIITERQRIERWDGSPDMTPYFANVKLTEPELAAIEAGREVDEAERRRRKTAKL